MMKLSDCNTQQRKAHANIYHACGYILNEMYNIIRLCPTTDERYLNAKKLFDRSKLAEEIYNRATHNIYNDGYIIICENRNSLLEEIRSCGKEWLMERCRERVELECSEFANPIE